MARILIVDDMKDRHDWFIKHHSNHSLVHAYSYDEAVIKLTTDPNFDVMFLDHDLSESSIMCDPENCGEKTGTDLAKYIDTQLNADDYPNLTIVCHSLNPAGRANMAKILDNSNFHVIECPFFNLKSIKIS